MQALPEIRRGRPTPVQCEKNRAHRDISRWTDCILHRWHSVAGALHASVRTIDRGARERVRKLSSIPRTNRRPYEKSSTSLALRRSRNPHRRHIGHRTAKAEDSIKIGVLHSLSGTMAISETILKDLMLMEVADIDAKGGLLGKKIKPIVVDPASNWPLFAEKARELLVKDKVFSRVRLLDVGVAQVRAAGVRGAQRAAVLSTRI